MMEPMPGRPLVTILIPTYRRSALLREAVLSACRQTYPELEILILDDASPDDTAAVGQELAAADPRVSYHRHPKNLGIVCNWRVRIAPTLSSLIPQLTPTPVWHFVTL